MSKQELLELVAPLSLEERRELRALLDEAPLSEELASDPMMKIVSELEKMPPMDAPPDFSINHDHYIRGGSKREM
jgi:hypothetical protein